MMGSQKTISFGSSIKKVLLPGLLLAGVAAGSLLAQELVRGTFTLTEGVKFAGAVLAPGRYTVSVEPITASKASGSMVSVFVRPEDKVGPVISTLGVATQQSCESSPSGLNLQAAGNEKVVRSLCLEKQGLMVDFDLGR